MNKQHSDILQGQLSIFDIECNEVEKPREVIFSKRKNSKNQGEPFSNIINSYKSTAARIVKQACGALIVELEDRTLYFNRNGINELVLKKDIALLPGDEILIVNQDKKVNDIQLKKLKDMHVEKYIKRKGDANILIPFSGKLIAINPKGWILEYMQKPKYHENELFVTEIAKKNTNLANKITKMDINITKNMNGSFGSENDGDEEVVKLVVGDRVEFNYDGPQVGEISSIYNNGETVNVIWDHKHTAFYYKKVRKIGGI